MILICNEIETMRWINDDKCLIEYMHGNAWMDKFLDGRPRCLEGLTDKQTGTLF